MTGDDRRRIRHRERWKQAVAVGEANALLPDRPQRGSIGGINRTRPESVGDEENHIPSQSRRLSMNEDREKNDEDESLAHFSKFESKPMPRINCAIYRVLGSLLPEEGNPQGARKTSGAILQHDADAICRTVCSYGFFHHQAAYKCGSKSFLREVDRKGPHLNRLLL